MSVRACGFKSHSGHCYTSTLPVEYTSTLPVENTSTLPVEIRESSLSGHPRTLALVRRSSIERKLRDNGDELKRAREDIRVSTEQLEQLTGEADEARIRNLVSETPLAEQSFQEASRHAETMRRHHTELQQRIEALEARQDALLDQMSGS